MNRYKLVFFLALLVVQSSGQDLKDGKAVIKAMYDKYKTKYYKNLTFVQQTIFYKEGKVEKEETWYEAMSLEKGLVIKINDMNGGNGMMFQADSQYVWRDNKLVSKISRIHDLLLLGFSVYSQEPAITISKLESSGYDFDRFKVDVGIDGKAEFVIGDENSPHFWIDTERLVFTRLQKRDRDGALIEIQFNNYQQLGKAWIAPEVVFLRNGQIILREAYHNVKAFKKLPILISVPSDFSKLSW